jgi:chorismate--pyruvate lyase
VVPTRRSGLFSTSRKYTGQYSAPSLRWCDPRGLSALQRPPRPLYIWLRDPQSLTAKLVDLSGGHFHVKVLRQVYAYPSLSERLVLGIRQQQLALIREVVLYGKNEPWVFARSVLPVTTLTGPLRRLRKQGSQPLGAFLFSLPNLQRGAIAVAHIAGHHGYVPAELHHEEPVWGRRSVFSVGGKALLVSEVFLDNLTRRLCSPA